MGIIKRIRDHFAEAKREKEATRKAFDSLPANAKEGTVMSNGDVYLGTIVGRQWAVEPPKPQ